MKQRHSWKANCRSASQKIVCLLWKLVTWRRKWNQIPKRSGFNQKQFWRWIKPNILMTHIGSAGGEKAVEVWSLVSTAECFDKDESLPLPPCLEIRPRYCGSAWVLLTWRKTAQLAARHCSVNCCHEVISATSVLQSTGRGDQRCEDALQNQMLRNLLKRGQI